MHEKKIFIRYFYELMGSILIYGLVLVCALKIGPTLPEGVWRTAVMISPMLPFLLAVWAIVRQFGRMDEYIRQWSLENIAIAAAVTAGWTFTYGFLENAGYPRISMFMVWPVMGAVWGLLACIRSGLNR